jgi:hypothetical protein
MSGDECVVAGVKEEGLAVGVLRDAGDREQHTTIQVSESCFPQRFSTRAPLPGLASAGAALRCERCARGDSARASDHPGRNNWPPSLIICLSPALSDTDTGDPNKRCVWWSSHTHRIFLIDRINAARYTVGLHGSGGIVVLVSIVRAVGSLLRSSRGVKDATTFVPKAASLRVNAGTVDTARCKTITTAAPTNKHRTTAYG